MAIQVHFAFLHCESTDDASTDEIIVRWAGQPIFGPRDMEEGSEVDVNQFVLLQGDSEVVELFDEDFPSDDHLGGHIIRKDELGQGFRTALFRNEDANYRLDYEVFQG